MCDGKAETDSESGLSTWEILAVLNCLLYARVGLCLASLGCGDITDE